MRLAAHADVFVDRHQEDPTKAILAARPDGSAQADDEAGRTSSSASGSVADDAVPRSRVAPETRRSSGGNASASSSAAGERARRVVLAREQEDRGSAPTQQPRADRRARPRCGPSGSSPPGSMPCARPRPGRSPRRTAVAAAGTRGGTRRTWPRSVRRNSAPRPRPLRRRRDARRPRSTGRGTKRATALISTSFAATLRVSAAYVQRDQRPGRAAEENRALDLQRAQQLVQVARPTSRGSSATAFERSLRPSPRWST